MITESKASHSNNIPLSDMKKVDNDSTSKNDSEWLNKLFGSCIVGDVETVSQLVDSKVYVDKTNEEDVTALQVI